MKRFLVLLIYIVLSLAPITASFPSLPSFFKRSSKRNDGIKPLNNDNYEPHQHFQSPRSETHSQERLKGKGISRIIEVKSVPIQQSDFDFEHKQSGFINDEVESFGSETDIKAYRHRATKSDSLQVFPDDKISFSSNKHLEYEYESEIKIESSFSKARLRPNTPLQGSELNRIFEGYNSDPDIDIEELAKRLENEVRIFGIDSGSDEDSQAVTRSRNENDIVIEDFDSPIDKRDHFFTGEEKS